MTSVMYDAYFNWHVSPFKSWSTSGALVIGEPLVDRSPHSFQMAACEYMMWKVYLESEYIFALLLVMRVRALVSAISSAFWEEVPEGSLEKEMTIHSSILFFFFHSSILTWRIPWIEEPAGIQSMGSQRVRHN